MERDWPALFTAGVRSTRRPALVIAAWFTGVGIAWVLIMDVLLYEEVSHPRLILKIQTINWLLVVVAGVAIYLVAHRAAALLTRARAVLSAVMDSAGDGMIVLGPDRAVVYANRAAVRMLEVRDADELRGMSAHDFSRRFLVSYPNGALVAPDAFLAQRAFTEPGPLHYKAMLYPSEGHELVIRATASAVRARPDHSPRLVVSVLHDITDTENLDRMRDRFFAAAAHGLKTPVAIIKANVQLMGRTVPPGLRPSTLAIERQCDRIDRLVQNLLVVSRARARSLQLHPHQMDLAGIVNQVALDLLAHSAREIHTEITATPCVHGDSERLATALRNLAYEAMAHATSRSPLTLRLTVDGDMAELGVRYQPLPVAERTFVGSEEYDDTTLSACATETIVEAHGGQVGEDTDGDHATRWARLPTMECR